MIKPALSTDEWDDVRRIPSSEDYAWRGMAIASGDRHKMAALALYEKPFGFSYDDVVILRQLPSALVGLGMGPGKVEDGKRNLAAWITGLADRIEALLPADG